MDKRSIYILIAYSALGNFIDLSFFTCLPVYLLKGNSSLYAGFSFSVMSLIGLLVLPFTGNLIDQGRKKRLLQGNALGLSCLFLSYFLLPPEAVFILSPVILILLNFQSSLVKTILPLLVDCSKLLHYNAIKSSLDTLAIFLAPGVSLWIFSSLSFHRLLWILGFLALGNAALASFLSLSYHKTKSSYFSFKQMKTTFLFIRENQHLLYLVLLFMALNFFIGGVEEIIYPSILLRHYSLQEKFLGIALSCTSLGAIIAGLSLMKKSSKRDLTRTIFLYIRKNAYFMIFLGGLSLIVTNKIHYFLLFCFFQLAIGFVTSRVNIPLETSFQKNVALDQQGQFFSFLAFSSRILVPLGILYSGFLVDQIGPGQTLIVNNLCIMGIIYLFRKYV